MLSNIQIKLDDSAFPMLVFDFFGRSMSDYTTIEGAMRSINPSNEKGNTTIYAEKQSAVERVQKEIDSENNYFVVRPFFNGDFVCSINQVKGPWVLFSFLSPDKTSFPNQYLNFDEIKSIHKVVKWQYDLITTDTCHCAVDGDYCGAGCVHPENNPEKKGEQNTL